MPFVTGTAGNITEVRTALINACTANGWTLSGEVLHKGSVFVRLQIVGAQLQLLGGTGIDAGNLLTGAGPNVTSIGTWGTDFSILYPATYEIHVHASPDEVYMVVNYNATDYQWCAFGQSGIQGLPGAGVWYGASVPPGAASVINVNDAGTQGNSQFRVTPVLFGTVSVVSTNFPSHIHHGFDDGAWTSVTASDTTDGQALNCIRSIAPLYVRQPNADGDGVLLPLRAYIARPGFRSSLALDCAHCRLIRIDNFEPRDLITLGPDTWRVYPWFRKSLVSRSGGSELSHTGTLGWAVRFDGVP